MASDPQQTVSTLAEQFQTAVADEDYATAESLLKQLDQHINALPDDWQQDAELVEQLISIQQTLATYENQLREARGDAKQQLDKLGKSKKGMKAYSK